MPPGRLVSASMVKLIGHNGVSISVRPFFALGAPTGCTDLFGNCPEDVATAVVLKTLLSPSVGVYSSFTLQQKKFAFIEIHSWVAFSTCSIFSVVDKADVLMDCHFTLMICFLFQAMTVFATLRDFSTASTLLLFGQHFIKYLQISVEPCDLALVKSPACQQLFAKHCKTWVCTFQTISALWLFPQLESLHLVSVTYIDLHQCVPSL